jgi:hypothetical protein
MSINPNTDPTRQLFEFGVSAGRSNQSPQTNFMHYCYTSQDEIEHDTIPVYENVLFANSLLRSRSAENILEAKSILSKILKFQNKNEGIGKGNFPIYLHDYPECKDRFVAAHLLPPFYWMIKQFSPVLGSELTQQLKDTAELALDHCQATQNHKPAPFHIALKIAAAQKVFGEMLQDKDLQKKGEDLIDQLRKQSEEPDFGTWYSPPYLADILVALQMAYPSIQDSPWKHVWNLLQETWHAQSLHYIGPGIREFQRGNESEVTLYDYFLGNLSGKFSWRAFSDHPRQIQGVLVQSTQEKLQPITYPFTKEGHVSGLRWHVHQEKNYAYSLVEKKGHVTPEFEKGFYPFRLVWGDADGSHSFVCQGGSSSIIDYKVVPHGVDLLFTFEDPPVVEDREKNRELLFFCDIDESTKILVNEKSATTFQLNDEIKIVGSGVSFALKIIFENGEGKFFGHIAPGNRLSQLSLKGENRFAAFDWQVFLRTVRRSTPCTLRVQIRFL